MAGGTRVLGEPGEDVADGRLAGLEAVEARHDAVLDHRRTSPRRPRARSPSRMWQVLVPMIITSVPGSVTPDGRGRHVRVDVRDRDRRPGAKPGPAPPRARSSTPARLPSGAICARHLLVDDVLEAADRAPRSSRRTGSRRASTTSPCSRPCSSLRVSTPVSCQTTQSAASISRSAARVDLGRLAQDLQRLREEPLGRDLAAVALEPRLAPLARRPALIRSASGWAAWCFQSFTQACGSRRSSRQLAQRRAVGERRQHRAGGEVDPDADDLRRVDAASRRAARESSRGTSRM